MYYKRKSFNVSLNDSILFTNSQGRTKTLKSFSLLSLSMDHFYFRNRIAYELLNELIHLDIFFAYANVNINSKNQGVYLIIENPKKYLYETKKATFILRRRYESSSFIERNNIAEVQLEYLSDSISNSQELDFFLNQYRSIYNLINQKKGEDLYQSLDEIMNIEEYMRIMAFNFIFCNGDYTDEQFFYTSAQNNTSRFNILPWDFDDIFENLPHEGWLKRNKQLIDNKHIFSVESDLDLIIAKDPFLYQKYLYELKEVLSILDSLDLKALYQETYNELYPFYINTETITQSKYDHFFTEYTIPLLEDQLNGTYSFLSHRIDSIYSLLKNEDNQSLKE
jgi:spore coat protein H